MSPTYLTFPAHTRMHAPTHERTPAPHTMQQFRICALVYDDWYIFMQILAWFDELKTNYSGWIDTLDIGNTYDGRIHRSLKVTITVVDLVSV